MRYKHIQHLATAKTWASKWVISFYLHLPSPSLLLTSTSWISSLPRTFATSSVTTGKAERLYKLHQDQFVRWRTRFANQNFPAEVLNTSEKNNSLKDTMEFITDSERQQWWNSQGKKLTFVTSVFPRLKASSERDFLHKTIAMRSHVLTKQNIILIQKEIAINQVWKGRF